MRYETENCIELPVGYNEEWVNLIKKIVKANGKSGGKSLDDNVRTIIGDDVRRVLGLNGNVIGFATSEESDSLFVLVFDVTIEEVGDRKGTISIEGNIGVLTIEEDADVI